jgi:probable HAF family extracellular repeat protein
VGQSQTPTGDLHAVLWEDGKITDLGVGGMAVAINSRGQIIGQRETASEVHAFLWEHGNITDLGTLGGGSSEAVAINARGDVVGRSGTASGEVHAVLWTTAARPFQKKAP